MIRALGFIFILMLPRLALAASAAGNTGMLVTTPGVWTPNDQSGAGLSITGADTVYVQNGKICQVSGVLTYPATADGGTAAVGGLGCTSRNGSGTIGGGTCQSGGGTVYGVEILKNTTTMEFRASGSGSPATNANLSTLALKCTVTYPTN